MASWSANGADWIEKQAANYQFKAVEAFEDELIVMTDKIIDKTPVGIEGGRLKSNWQIAPSVNSKHLKTKRGASTKPGFASKKIKGRLAKVDRFKIKRTKGRALYLFNNSPYVNVVEFGGYPDPVKLGTWNKKKKRYEIRSSGGYSKQAPRGMFRLNVLLYKRRINRKIKAI